MDDISDPSRFDVQAYQMLVDSRNRDTVAYPSAAEYVVDLSDTPFRHVVGVNLLAGSVPRTAYAIDNGYNAFALALGAPPYSPGNVVTVLVDPGDYNVPQLCSQLNAQLASANLATVAASPLTNPAEISNRLAFDSPEPFALFLDRQTLGGKIGFGAAVAAADVAAGLYAATPAWTATRFQDANVYVAVQQASTAADAAFVGPVPWQTTIALQANVVYSQRFTPLAAGVPETASLSIVGNATVSASVTIGAANAAPIALGSAPGASTDPSAPVVVPLAGSIAIQPTDVAFLSFQVSAPCDLYVDASALPPDPNNAILVAGNVQTASSSACATLYVRYTGYRVTAPGVVDLTGDRFLLVRCPEVESYMYGGDRRASASTHPGIGMLTLGTYGYAETRLDFFTSQPRTLKVPIARLSKMTIQLQSQNGNAYPTRGCDHTLLVNVRFLVPKPAPALAAPASILAPGYSPDAWEYARRVQARARPAQFAHVTG